MGGARENGGATIGHFGSLGGDIPPGGLYFYATIGCASIHRLSEVSPIMNTIIGNWLRAA